MAFIYEALQLDDNRAVAGPRLSEQQHNELNLSLVKIAGLMIAGCDEMLKINGLSRICDDGIFFKPAFHTQAGLPYNLQVAVWAGRPSLNGHTNLYQQIVPTVPNYEKKQAVSLVISTHVSEVPADIRGINLDEMFYHDAYSKISTAVRTVKWYFHSNHIDTSS